MLLRNFHMVVPVNRSIFSPENFTASPRTPIDMKFASPGRSKRYNNGGVGLGIVAAAHEISSKQNPVCLADSGSSKSDPVHCARRCHIPTEIDLSEEYTCVTSRDGMTRVYYNDGEKFEFCHRRSECDRRLNKPVVDIAEELPAKKREVLKDSQDFLSLCCLCKKKLQGKDIYMYKGDQGFCSKECRSVRIMMDDNVTVKHKSSSVDVLRFGYAGGQSSSAGIFVI